MSRVTPLCDVARDGIIVIIAARPQKQYYFYEDSVMGTPIPPPAQSVLSVPALLLATQILDSSMDWKHALGKLGQFCRTTTIHGLTYITPDNRQVWSALGHSCHSYMVESVFNVELQTKVSENILLALSHSRDY